MHISICVMPFPIWHIFYKYTKILASILLHFVYNYTCVTMTSTLKSFRNRWLVCHRSQMLCTNATDRRRREKKHQTNPACQNQPGGCGPLSKTGGGACVSNEDGESCCSSPVKFLSGCRNLQKNTCKGVCTGKLSEVDGPVWALDVSGTGPLLQQWQSERQVRRSDFRNVGTWEFWSLDGKSCGFVSSHRRKFWILETWR